MDDSVFLHCLAKIPGVGAEKLRKLLSHFGSAEAAWKGSATELEASGIPMRLTGDIVRTRPSVDPDREMHLLDKQGVRVIPRESADYPTLLHEIPNPPHLLYFRGNIRINASPFITIVGTRRPTQYGLSITREFSRELARVGLVVVSGLALGIDQEAHRGALGEGETLAVLGSGIDDPSIAPRTHLGLAQAIMDKGGLISDYPPGTRASEGTFPARNRLMAGISLGTIVIESTERSGTLITARLALEFNREVFAVPGSIYSEYSQGPHHLLREGAILAGSVSHILDALPLERILRDARTQEDTIHSEDLSENEYSLLKTLGCDTLHIDTIVKRSAMSTSDILAALAFLEMKGVVKNIGSMHYVRTYTIQSR